MRYRFFFHTFSLYFILIICNGCTASKQSAGNGTHNGTDQEKIFAVTNVNIITMATDNKIIENATVVIKDKKILSINSPIPDKAKLINGKGKWLIPGLIDMHVHNLADVNFGSNYPTKGANAFTNTQDFMLLYIANGVTTAFELSARPEHFGERNEIIKGNVTGPRIALALLIEAERDLEILLIRLKTDVKRYGLQKRRDMNLLKCIPV